MGARLVGQTFAFGVEVPLKPNEFRLLAHMALTAIDDDAEPRYFDSRSSAALALGRRVPDEDTPERRAALTAVKEALTGLVKVGAIVRIHAGRPGRRAEYYIRLDVFEARRTAEFAARIKQRREKPRPPAPRSNGAGQTCGMGQDRPAEWGRTDLRNGAGQTFPSGTTRNHEGTEAGTTSPNASTSLARVVPIRGSEIA